MQPPFGLNFDDTMGLAGFATRWHTGSRMPSQQPAHALPPRVPKLELFIRPTPYPLVFAAPRCLLGWPELPPDVRAEPIWLALTLATGEEAVDVEGVYLEYAREAPADDLVAQASKIGGSASFAQEDPRGDEDRNGPVTPALDDPAARLIVELDQDLLDWGNGGVGHLYGDPTELASGDLSSLRYHWDCR